MKPRIFRVFWRDGVRQRSHFMFFETEHDSIDSLTEALGAGLVVGNELFVDRSNKDVLRITRRVRTAIRADDVLRPQEPWERIEDQPSLARA